MDKLLDIRAEIELDALHRQLASALADVDQLTKITQLDHAMTKKMAHAISAAMRWMDRSPAADHDAEWWGIYNILERSLDDY